MGKTWKKNGEDNPRPSKVKPQVKKEKAPKVRGPKPDYTPRAEQEARKYAEEHTCYDINQLLDGVYSKEIYLINGVQFLKAMFPLYKDAEQEILFIVADYIPNYHPLALAGVQPGTRIPFFHLERAYFATKMKDEGVRKAVEELWRFLRNAKYNNLANEVVLPQVEDSAEEPTDTTEEVIEHEASSAAKIIWDGTRVGLIETRGVTFEISQKKLGKVESTMIGVRSAPQESGLTDVEIAGVTISINELHRNSEPEHALEKTKNNKCSLWTFLRKVMEEEGLLVAKKPSGPRPLRPAKTTPPAEFKTRPLFEMIQSHLGFYDLDGVLVKLFGPAIGQQIEVVKIGEGNDLSKHGIEIGFTILAKWVADDTSLLHSSKDYGQIVALVNYIRGVLIKNGIIKSFKKAEQQQAKVMISTEKPRNGITAPQFGREKSRICLATSDGQVVGGGGQTSSTPNPLAKGFLSDSHGYWRTNDGITFRSWSNEGQWYAKVISAPEGHVLYNFKPFIKLGHLQTSEVGFPGKELREYLRVKLREIGELPDNSEQTKQASA